MQYFFEKNLKIRKKIKIISIFLHYYVKITVLERYSLKNSLYLRFLSPRRLFGKNRRYVKHCHKKSGVFGDLTI